MSLRFNRRSLMRGLLGGAGVCVGLPALDTFLNGNGTAYAEGAKLPTRFGTYFWGLGLTDTPTGGTRWVPKTTGAGYEITPDINFYTFGSYGYKWGQAYENYRLPNVVLGKAATDTAAALRGAEMGAQIMLKATKVDGVYTADPKKDPAATRYTSLTFDEAIARNLQVLDATAFALCRDQKLPIKVFSIFKPGALKRVVLGEDEGTLVHV